MDWSSFGTATVAYGAGIFMIIGSDANTLWTSDDEGATWTARTVQGGVPTIPGLSTGDSPMSLVYSTDLSAFIFAAAKSGVPNDATTVYRCPYEVSTPAASTQFFVPYPYAVEAEAPYKVIMRYAA